MWLNMDDPLMADVPLNVKAVNRLEDFFFDRPKPMDMNVQIAVGASDDPMAMKGALVRLSPFEIVAALIQAVARAVRTSAPQQTLEEIWVSKYKPNVGLLPRLLRHPLPDESNNLLNQPAPGVVHIRCV